jgi:hypothetical protein
MVAVAASTVVVAVAAAWEVPAAEEVAPVLVSFVMGYSDSVEGDLDFEVGSFDSVKGNPDFAAEKDLAVNGDLVVGSDFALVVLAVEFQVLELVDLVASEALDLAVEVLGFELVVPGLEEEVLALVKEDPDFVRDPVIAWANLVARVDLDVARDVLELA